uniref:RING-box protein 2 n=1 Tax=Panagrellus redivivus TaxID=6233 RepID=A0A7E4V5M8_PANRE
MTMDVDLPSQTKTNPQPSLVVGASSSNAATGNDPHQLFKLKRWNPVALWTWDVDCDTCAICRVNIMEACLRCQSDAKNESCVVVWGDCNHSFHNCCMALWVKQNNRCPLCQVDWSVSRVGK